MFGHACWVYVLYKNGYVMNEWTSDIWRFKFYQRSYKDVNYYVVDRACGLFLVTKNIVEES